MTATAVRRSCDAVVRLTAGEWQMEPVTCKRTVGVRTFISTGGLRIGYCGLPSHRANVRGRFAEQAPVPEPEWDLEDGPDHADSMNYAKAWAEWLHGEGGDLRRWGA